MQLSRWVNKILHNSCIFKITNDREGKEMKIQCKKLIPALNINV